jgi:hypothetical protein
MIIFKDNLTTSTEGDHILINLNRESCMTSSDSNLEPFQQLLTQMWPVAGPFGRIQATSQQSGKQKNTVIP